VPFGFRSSCQRVLRGITNFGNRARVPRGFLALLRQSRGPLIAVAIGIVVLQTLVTGLATARASALMVADPLGTVTICHGAGGEAPALPMPDNRHADCCVFCNAAAPAMLPAAPLASERNLFTRQGSRPISDHHVVLIARRAVCAGVSHAPPTIA
jgi:hypothetical protein